MSHPECNVVITRYRKPGQTFATTAAVEINGQRIQMVTSFEVQRSVDGLTKMTLEFIPTSIRMVEKDAPEISSMDEQP